MRFEPAPEYQVFPTREHPLKPYEAAVRAARETQPLIEEFAPDAIVPDEGQTYDGLAAIKNWMASTKKKYGHTVAPLELVERGGQSVLKARLTGNFPGSPITVNFSFVLADGKLRSLEIRA